MDISIVVPAQLILFFRSPATQWLADIAVCILTADHEADLARRVGGNCRVSVFDGWEDFLAILLQLGDER
jgi:hypothetical protein